MGQTPDESKQPTGEDCHEKRSCGSAAARLGLAAVLLFSLTVAIPCFVIAGAGAGSGWVIDMVDPAAGGGTSLALADDGAAYLAYSGKGVFLARRSGWRWYSEKIDPRGAHWGQIDVELMENDVPVVLAAGRYFERNQSGWKTSYPSVGSWTGLDVSSTGVPYVSGQVIQRGTKYNAACATIRNGVWEKQTVGSGIQPHATDIVLDGSDYPHLAYTLWEGSCILWYAYRRDGQWTTEGVPAVWRSSLNVSLTLDSAGQPHIASGGGYSFKEKGTWQSVAVDTHPEKIRSSCIALDSKGHATVAYGHGASNELRLATWTGSSWLRETIDSGGRVSCIDLAYDLDGKPWISYRMESQGLKVAHLTGTPTKLLLGLGFVGIGFAVAAVVVLTWRKPRASAAETDL